MNEFNIEIIASLSYLYPKDKALLINQFATACYGEDYPKKLSITRQGLKSVLDHKPEILWYQKEFIMEFCEKNHLFEGRKEDE